MPNKSPQEEIIEGVYYNEPHPNQDCCDKCHDVTFEKTYPAHTAYHACLNRKCECHKKNPYQDLENKALSEFRKVSKDNHILWHTSFVDEEELITNFLKSHLQLAYEAGKEEKDREFENERVLLRKHEIEDLKQARQQAIAEVLEELKQELFPTGGVIDVDKFPDKVFDKLQELQNK